MHQKCDSEVMESFKSFMQFWLSTELNNFAVVSAFNATVGCLKFEISWFLCLHATKFISMPLLVCAG